MWWKLFTFWTTATSTAIATATATATLLPVPLPYAINTTTTINTTTFISGNSGIVVQYYSDNIHDTTATSNDSSKIMTTQVH